MPDSLFEPPFYLLALGVGLWFIVSIAGANALHVMENAALKRLDEPEAQTVLSRILTHEFADQPWFQENGFEPVGVFRISNVDMAVWQRTGERTYLSIYVAKNQRRTVDVESMLDDDGGLATGNSSDGHVLPTRPGHWKQCLAVKNVAELCRSHDVGLWFLAQATGARPSREEIDIEAEIVQATKSQCVYVRSLPLWFVRLPYWYFVRRSRLYGKSVREQYERQRPLTVEVRRSPSEKSV